MGLNEKNSPLSPSYFFSQFFKRVCSIFHFSTWKLGNLITFPSSSSHLQGFFCNCEQGVAFICVVKELKTSSFLLWSERHWLWNIRSPINAFVLWELGGVRLPREFKPGLPWTVPWLNFEFSIFFSFHFSINQTRSVLNSARAHINHNRHNQQWCPFFKPVYFLAQIMSNYGLFWPIWANLSPIYALFGGLFTGLNRTVVYQNWQM